jgi:hypothetical protein
MTTMAAPALNAHRETASAGHAQLAYQARAPLPDADMDLRIGPKLNATSIESPYGPTVVLSTEQDRPGSPMLMLSAGLLRRLLSMARAMGPARSRGRRRRGRRLDIRV